MTRFTRIAAFVLLLLALMLGGYAWVLGSKAIPAEPVQTAEKAPSPVQFDVVVAAKPLTAGRLIEQSAVRVVQLPIRPVDALTDVTAVVGRVPVFDLSENTPLTEGQLVSGLALRLEQGERAVAVKADEVMGVGHRIRPGDFVDVFFVLKSDHREVDRSQARLLLPRLRVLAFGAASVDGAPTRGDASQSSRETAATRPEPARTAVLAVPVAEVNRLALGDAHARLLLALRRPDDVDLPVPGLFADLPAALQPLARVAERASGQGQQNNMQGMDRAHAGLTTTDLAEGGGVPQQPSRPVATAAKPASRAAPARTSTDGAGLQVEMIRGAQRDMVRY